ncbi:MAG TPA: hypothetical protein PK668_20945 [Myxococcota bacterium]|nr:hypothetical protein [Myxococcota bacterium]HRY96620.1 hypothetical protein [Myxococcota bacterium]HSA21415.1 hypothetical protein [Myxococcota bacterium]
MFFLPFLLGLAAGVGFGALVSGWDEIVDLISDFLHSHGWQRSWLMRALVVFDQLVCGLRRLIVVQRAGEEPVLVEERELEEDELPDDVRAALGERERVVVDVLEQLG